MSMIESLNTQDDVQAADLIVLAFNSELLIRARLLNLTVPQDALFDRAGVKRVASMLAAHAAPIERPAAPIVQRQIEQTPVQRAMAAVDAELSTEAATS
jgi:hypothetical protein